MKAFVGKCGQKISTSVEDLPNLRLMWENVVKTALIYSVVTIYLGLRTRIKTTIDQLFHSQINFFIHGQMVCCIKFTLPCS